MKRAVVVGRSMGDVATSEDRGRVMLPGIFRMLMKVARAAWILPQATR